MQQSAGTPLQSHREPFDTLNKLIRQQGVSPNKTKWDLLLQIMKFVSETLSLQLVYMSDTCRRHFHLQPHVVAPPNPSIKQVCAHCLLIMSSTAALDTETEPWWSSIVPTFISRILPHRRCRGVMV